MLNRVLYERLRQTFGQVMVQNENIAPALIRDGRSDVSWSIDQSKRDGWGETYIINCPICGDRKGHCYISCLSFAHPIVEGMEFPQAPLLIHCFRRDCFHTVPGAKEKLIDLLNCPEENLTLTADESSGYFGDDPALFSDLHENTLQSLRKWQPDYHPMTDAPAEVLDYCRKRNLDINELKILKAGWGKCWNFKKEKFINDRNWLLFPIIDQAGVRGFQARRLEEGFSMKYFFDTRTPAKMVLYNRDRASRFYIVAIAEGVIDAIHIGPCGMAFFGSKPSPAQVRLIRQDGAKMVLYLPDQKKHFDASGACDLNPCAIADQLIAEWRENKLFEWGAYRIDLPKGDAGECSRAEIWKTVVEQLDAEYHISSEILEQLGEQLKRVS